ncbi:hypothetical protein ACX1C1_08475 [Paenibacillus sp. strain BS8-2]
MPSSVEILDAMEIAEVLYFQFRNDEKSNAAVATSRVIEELRDMFYNDEIIYKAAILTQLSILNRDDIAVSRYLNKFLDTPTYNRILNQLFQLPEEGYVRMIDRTVKKVHSISALG